MTKIGNFLFFLGFFFYGFIAMAAGTTVQATADRTEVGLGDSFGVTVSAISTDDVDVQDPRVPDLDGFDLLSSQSSTAVAQRWVQGPNGNKFETQRRKEYLYTLSPRKAGTLSIGAFEVVISGKVFRTQPIVIKVGGQGSGQGNQQQGHQRNRPPGFDDNMDEMDRSEEEMFNQLLQQRQRVMQQMMQQQGAGMPDENLGQMATTGIDNPEFRSLPTNPNEAFYIGVEVDKTEVYEGEQVTVNWYVYTRGQMETLDRLKFPDLKGFWKEIIEEVPSIQFVQVNVGGVPWKRALLASHALFPIKAGTARIDEYKIKSRVRLPQQGYGYVGKAYEYTKSSVGVPIKVKPLPVEGRPSDFSGAVGQFEVHARVEEQNLPVNQPLSLKVRFEGAGNAKLIDLPAMNLPAGLEQYDTKSESKFFKNGRSFKEFEVLLIPRQEGDVTIPAMSVSMFDPKTSKYYTRKTEEIKLKIVNNPNAPVGSSQRMTGVDGKPAAAPAKVEENKLPNVIMAWEPSAQASVMYRPWLWALIYLSAFGALVWKSQRELGWGRRRRSLKDQVAKRYKVVDQALGKEDFRTVGTEMTNIFYLVLGHVAGESGAAQQVHDLMTQIPPSLRRDYGDEIAKTFETFQTLSFAPEEMLGSLKSKDSMKTNVERAKKVIAQLISSKEEK